MTISNKVLSRPLVAVLLPVAATLLMGIALPSCPGQEAMQQQIDQLTQGEAQLKRQVQQLQGALTETQKQLNEARALLAEVSNTVLAHRDALAKLDQSVQALATKPAPAAKKRK